MINFITGKIEYKGKDYVVVDVCGIGYMVYVNNGLLSGLNKNEELKLFTFHRVREDASDLYGFIEREELGFFTILLSVSGIGPKSALSILSKAPINKIKEAILIQDSSILIDECGIGKKTAERLVMELKNKIKDDNENNQIVSKNFNNSDSHAIDALVSLGYNKAEAVNVIKKAPDNITLNEKIKWALKNM